MSKRWRYFAIGMGNWIEIRRGHSPPRTHRSTLNLKTKKSYYYPNAELDIPIFNYTGGEVLTTIDRHHLYCACKMLVQKGDMKEIKTDIKKVLKAGI